MRGFSIILNGQQGGIFVKLLLVFKIESTVWEDCKRKFKSGQDTLDNKSHVDGLLYYLTFSKVVSDYTRSNLSSSKIYV